MQLKEHLAEYTKQNLLQLAKSFDLKRYSTLRKGELIDRIVEHFCSEEVLRCRLACLTDEQMSLFRKASVTPQNLSIHKTLDGMQLYRYFLGFFENPTDLLCVYDDVLAAFQKIDDEAFKEEQYKKGWLTKCIHFFIQFYGIAPIEIVHKIYCQKVKCSIDEMIQMLMGMPMDIVESCIFSMEWLGLQDWPKDDLLYSERGILVHLPLLEEDSIDYLLSQQMDKEFYIPSVQQIDEICRIGYEASSFAYKKLESYFMKKFALSYELAVTWCLQVWANCYCEESPIRIIDKMSQAGIDFINEKMINEFMEVLMSAYNSTRLKANRGHQPNELVRRDFSGGMPTIVPGSSHAAAILKEAAPQLQAMGIPIDLEENADVIPSIMFPNGLNHESVRMERKVYPNDPCPCGSGRKYKQCCGRR